VKRRKRWSRVSNDSTKYRPCYDELREKEEKEEKEKEKSTDEGDDRVSSLEKNATTVVFDICVDSVIIVVVLRCGLIAVHER